MKKVINRQPLALVILIAILIASASMFAGCTCGQHITIPPSEFSSSDGGGNKDQGPPDPKPDTRPDMALDASPEPAPEPIADASEPTSEPAPEPTQDAGPDEVPEKGCRPIEKEPCEGRACVKDPTLTVSKSSFVVSSSVVKGAKRVDVLSIALSLDDVSDGTLEKLTVRLYADSQGGANFSATGDTDASKLIASASLYEGNTLIAGPLPLQLVDSVGDGFTSDQDFHQVTFEKLRFKLQRNRTDKVIIKVDLLSSFTGKRFIAAGLNPKTDLEVVDGDDRIVDVASCDTVNMGSPKDPQIAILERGRLTVNARQGTADKIIVGGTSDYLIGQYIFTAEAEPFGIQRLTAVSDLLAQFGDKAEATPVVDTLKVLCPDINGVERSVALPMAGGSVTFTPFTGMSQLCYVPKDSSITAKIYLNTKVVDSNTFALSGQQFRIGLQGVGNTSATFEAVGMASNAVINQPDTYTGHASIDTYTLRRSKPVFKYVPQPSTLMPTPGKAIYSWEVCAVGGNIGIGRYNAVITTNGLDSRGSDIRQFQVFGSAGLISTASVVGISASVLVDLTQKGLADLYPTQNGIANGSYAVVIAFPNEQVIAQGQCRRYEVRATIVGATTNDTVSFEFPAGKETPLSLATQCRNPLTGQVYGTLGSIYQKPENFLKEALVNTMLLWSDFSGGRTDTNGQPMSAVHTYPTVQNGQVQSNSSTCDWTNGRRTNFRDLLSWNFKK